MLDQQFFPGTDEIFFTQRWLAPPPLKIGPYAYRDTEALLRIMCAISCFDFYLRYHGKKQQTVVNMFCQCEISE